MLETDDNCCSQPVVVAKTIVKAAMANRPKTRYSTVGGAKIILFLRRILSDRMFDNKGPALSIEHRSLLNEAAIWSLPFRPAILNYSLKKLLSD